MRKSEILIGRTYGPDDSNSPARIAVNPIVVRHAHSGGYASPDLVSVIPFSQFHGHASGVFDSAGPLRTKHRKEEMNDCHSTTNDAQAGDD